MSRKNKIKSLPFAGFHAFLAALIGLVAGILYSVGGLLIDTLVSLGWIISSETPGLSFGTVLAFGALFGMPLLFGIGGFLVALVGSLLFNMISRWMPLFNLDFKQEKHGAHSDHGPSGDPYSEKSKQ